MGGYVFCLLTDFGLRDPYVCQMKGRILSEIQDAIFLDISHEIQSHNIYQAGFFLASTWEYLPKGSIVIGVVDPGVGSNREILILSKDSRRVICPDNGLVTELLSRHPSNTLFFFARQEIMGQCISSTFHGRDIFAPLAVRLARGELLENLAVACTEEEIKTLALNEIELEREKLRSIVIHIDKFGNCVLNIPSCWWPSIALRRQIFLKEPLKLPLWVSKSYFAIPPEEAGIVEGSQGYLELAMNQKSFAHYYGISIGDVCVLDLGFSPKEFRDR